MPIHVRSTFSDNEGTIIREDYTMKANEHVIQGVADDTNVAKVSVVGVEINRALPIIFSKVWQIKMLMWI